MATRSTIALEFADGTVGQVYCHWDGYVSNNGRILEGHWKDPFKLRDLIDRGGMSSLKETLEGCEFYKSEGDKARYFSFYEDYIENAPTEEYNYILRCIDGEPTWFVSEYDMAFEKLTDRIESEKRETV
jgi:hypothetical protein